MGYRDAPGDPDSFTRDYVRWGQIPNRGKVDRALSASRGESVTANLDRSISLLDARASKESNNPDTRAKAERQAKVSRTMQDTGVVRDAPTRVNDIAGRYAGLLDTATDRAIQSDTAIGGTAWYFDQRREQDVHVDPSANLNSRQVTAMGGKLSSSKTPEDETTSLRGISRLMGGAHKDSAVGGVPLSEMPSADVARSASQAATWKSHESGNRRGRAPGSPRPDTDHATFHTLADAGRAHTDNVKVATDIARGNMQPNEAFDPRTTPKTAAYAEMQAQSNPGSLVETDYRNVSAHYRDVKAGTQSKDQGMFMFSQDKPGERPYALRSDSPTAIDTWMGAAGSGQDLKATPPEGGRSYSPAKRLVDKDAPLDMGGSGKGRMGLSDLPANVTPAAAISAQHNEAIRRVSENIVGSVSFDQHGQDVKLPSSLIQETVWTETRQQANADPVFNAQQRDNANAAKVTSRNLQRAAKQQGKLF